MTRYSIILLLLTSPVSLAQLCQSENSDADDITSSFVDGGSGVVLQPSSSLEWMRCSLGQEWSGGRCLAEVDMYTWSNARQAAEEYVFNGHEDWRLPTIEELQSIIKSSCVAPSIDLSVFPDTPTKSYWSGSLYGKNAWRVYFGDGFKDNNNNQYVRAAVRLVRQTSGD